MRCEGWKPEMPELAWRISGGLSQKGSVLPL